MKYFQFALLLLLVLPVIANKRKFDPAVEKLWSIKNGFVVDKDLRVIMTRGSNVVIKRKDEDYNYLPRPYAGQDTADHSFNAISSLVGSDLDDLKALGVNSIRLGILWEAVQKKPMLEEDYQPEIEEGTAFEGSVYDIDLMKNEVFDKYIMDDEYFDFDYLDKVSTIIQQSEERGITVLLDNHMDVSLVPLVAKVLPSGRGSISNIPAIIR